MGNCSCSCGSGDPNDIDNYMKRNINQGIYYFN